MRVRPCSHCGKPVQSLTRGRPKQVHEECKAHLRKVRDAARDQKKARHAK